MILYPYIALKEEDVKKLNQKVFDKKTQSLIFKKKRFRLKFMKIITYLIKISKIIRESTL